jgi:hypothetical protein
MMFGAKVRFGVTFKANQPDFTIYTRKYGHNFKVPVDLTDHEGAIGATLKSLSRYVIAHGINLTIYDQHTFKNTVGRSNKKLQSFKVPDSQDKNVTILHMIVSADDRRIALGIGRNLIKDQQETTEIVVYRYNDDKEEPTFEIEKIIDHQFLDSSPKFLFRHGHETELIFFSKEAVLSVDYMDEGKEREVLYTFQKPMEDVPKFGVFNGKQECFVVTSAKSVFFVNVRTKEEVDIGTREMV